MKNIRKKILKKVLPLITVSILALVLGCFLRFAGGNGILHTLGYILILVAVMALTVLGNPMKRFKKQ